jgi:hypothetical protein
MKNATSSPPSKSGGNPEHRCEKVFSVPSPAGLTFNETGLFVSGTGIKIANFYFNRWLRLVLVVNGLPVRAFLLLGRFGAK